MVSGRWIAFAAVIGGVLGACGGDEGDGDEGNAGGGAPAGSSSVGVVGTELDANILFSPMYSAYDGVHDFKLPAIVSGYTDVQWDVENKDLATLERLSDNSVMITTRGAGMTRIIARSGSLSGSAMLIITEATPAAWELGEMRYNNGVALPPIDMATAMMMGVTIPDDLSCRNCHGGGAMALSVEHTPQQTGGYSDTDLVNIFTMGQKPPTAGWTSGIPEFIYMRLHTWTATEEEKLGIITYLRSFEPKSQGDIDFGGLFNRDGGT